MCCMRKQLVLPCFRTILWLRWLPKSVIQQCNLCAQYPITLAFNQTRVDCFNQVERVVALVAYTSWRASVYDRFTLVWKTNCMRQPERQLPSSSYNHNTLTTLRTAVKESISLYDPLIITITLAIVCNQGNHSTQPICFCNDIREHMV